MSTPAWLTELLDEHQSTEGFYGSEGHEVYRNYACVCGWWSTADGESSHRAHVADGAWQAISDPIRTLIAKWQADADLCDEAGIESPTMPIRAAIADLRGLLGEER